MNSELHNKFVTIIEEVIEKSINNQEGYSWRELKSKKSKMIYESINCLISFIRTKSNYLCNKFEYSVLSEKDRNKLILSFERLGKEYKNIDISVSTIYQILLADDLKFEGTGYRFVIDKHQRDNLGSYYTPDWLADELTNKTLHSYFKKNKNRSARLHILDLQNIKVIDLSVGGGAFLKAYIRWVKRNVSEDLSEIKKIVGNVYGIDVDPTALLICEHEISSELDGEIGLINLFLGNPLIENNILDEKMKISMFHEGRIYNIHSGLSMSFIQNKFDIVIGNPPWEKIRFEDKKFFKQKYPNISNLSQKTSREKAIENLRSSESSDYKFYKDIYNDYIEVKNHLKSNSLLKYSLSGELNTYNLFYELALNLLKPTGVVGLIVKASMVKTPANKKLFNFLVSDGMLVEVDLIKNSKKIFNIDSREEFAFVISSLINNSNFLVFPNITSKKDFSYEENAVQITPALLKKLNPDSGMLPNVSTSEQMTFLKKMHSNNPLFSDVFPNVRFGRLVHFTNHSSHIHTSKDQGIPIYEGKFIERYDSRFSTFKGMTFEQKYKPKANALVQISSLKNIPESRYFIEPDFWNIISKNYNNEPTVMWRSLTSSTNRRTMLATVLPFVPTSQSIQFLQAGDTKKTILILSIFNSIVFDYLVRIKIPGIDLTQSVIKSIPVPNIQVFEQSLKYKGKVTTYFNHIFERVSWLLRSESRLKGVISNSDKNKGYISNKQCEAELDQIIGKAYGLSKEEIKKIAGQFPAYYSVEELELFF